MLPANLVYVNLPRTGLGNKLLVWAKAKAFAEINDFPLVTSSWFHIPLGPLLRGERSKRLYLDYFQERQALNRLQKILVQRTHHKIVEPPVARVEAGNRRLFVFEEVPPKTDYFGDFREFQEPIRKSFWEMVHPTQRKALQKTTPPVLGVHVRRGDFSAASAGNALGVNHVQTPIEYFVDAVQRLRQASGYELPVTLFSDGHDEELQGLLSLPGVKRAEAAADIIDLLSLAQSQVVVASSRSTFSYWAGFLANGPLILHPSHMPTPIRPEGFNRRFWEGALPEDGSPLPALLVENLRSLPFLQSH